MCRRIQEKSSFEISDGTQQALHQMGKNQVPRKMFLCIYRSMCCTDWPADVQVEDRAAEHRIQGPEVPHKGDKTEEVRNLIRRDRTLKGEPVPGDSPGSTSLYTFLRIDLWSICVLNVCLFVHSLSL